jgi:deoxyadenosine/deoxycytidine kinase
VGHSGREYENSISIGGSRMNDDGWIQTYDKGKLLIIDVDNINFVDNPEDLGTINRIDAVAWVVLEYKLPPEFSENLENVRI